MINTVSKIFLVICASFLICGLGLAADPRVLEILPPGEPKAATSRDVSSSQPAPSEGTALSEEHILKLNKDLKSSIEENKRLFEAKKALETQMEKMRGASQADQGRFTELINQRDSLTQKASEMEAANKKLSEEIEKLKKDLAEAKVPAVVIVPAKPVEAKPIEVEVKPVPIAAPKPLPAPPQVVNKPVTAPVQTPPAVPKEFGKVLTKLDKIKQQEGKLRNDAAQVHYSMGNVFFRRGEYVLAADEYRQAIKANPLESSFHYSLAFVSGEFLADPATAANHYQKYLELNPKAPDAEQVRKKLDQARIKVQSRQK